MKEKKKATTRAGRQTAPWVVFHQVAPGEKLTRVKCTRCEEVVGLELPMRVTMLCKLVDTIIAEHAECRPADPKSGGAVIERGYQVVSDPGACPRCKFGTGAPLDEVGVQCPACGYPEAAP